MRNLLMFFLMLLSACGKSREPLVWQWTLESRSYGDPIVDGNRIYVVSQSGQVIAGDIRDGQKIWEKKLGEEIVCSPAVSLDNIFVATRNGKIYAFARETGRKLWVKQLADSFEAPLTFKSDLLLAPSATGILYAFSPDGTERWQLSGNKKFTSQALIRDGSIYAGNWQHQFLCVDHSGKIRWHFQGNCSFTENALFHENILYVPCYQDHLLALDAQTGRLLWKVQSKFPGTPAILGNKLIAPDLEGIIRILHPKTGKIEKQMSFPKRIRRVYSEGNRCYVLGDHLYIWEAGSERPMKLYQTSIPLYRIALGPGVLIVTTEISNVLAFRR